MLSECSNKAYYDILSCFKRYYDQLKYNKYFTLSAVVTVLNITYT